MPRPEPWLSTNTPRCRLLRAAVAIIGALGACGCSGVFAKGDGRAIGDDLGRFSIDAALEKSTCGDGALAGASAVTFDVFLSKAPPHVYWNSGADSVEGDLAPDGVHFDFHSETVMTLPGSEPASEACTIVRSDASTGVLDDAESARRLTGALEYRFTIQGRSDCSDALSAMGVDALPCSQRYSLAGRWVSAR